MDSCYSSDHNGEDHVHTDITICNILGTTYSRSTALEWSVSGYCGGGGMGEERGGA